MQFIQHQKNIHERIMQYKSGFEHWEYWCSDVHFDSAKCDRKLFFKHLGMANELQASIRIFGDFFDVMGCENDPRSGHGDIRPEYESGNYLDKVIDDAADQLMPYVKNADFLLTYGNHETNIIRRQNTDPIQRLVQQLQWRGAKQVEAGGYSGWLALKFTDKSGSGVRRQLVHYHHGFGGNAPRTKGTLRVDIDSKNYPLADFIVRGHDHQKWHFPYVSGHYLNTNTFQTYEKKQHHIALGSYKNGLSNRYNGFEVQKGFSPTTLGGWFVKFTLASRGASVLSEVHEAQ